MSTKTLTAIYDDLSTANHAISMLKTNGFSDGELSILAADGSFDKNIKIEEHTKAPEGTSTGAVVGGAVGATLAGLTAVGTVTLTGGAGLVAAGPIVAALAGGGAGAATSGVIGGLIGMGMPETEAKLVDERLGTGNVMLGVTIESEQKDLTKALLDKSGAHNITVH